jgi:Chromosome segregation ATPases
MPVIGPWRYWFVVLDDLDGVSDVGSLIALSREVQEPVVRVIESLGGRVIHRHWVVNAVSFEASQDVALRIASLGYTVIPSTLLELQMVEIRRGDVEPLDPIGVDTIGARKLHNLGVTGAGVRVAVLDTGIENLHPWLMRDLRSVVAWEVDATGTGMEDYCGKRKGYHWGGIHGTHIAGIIAGQHPRTPGIAPGALIYDIIVFREETLCLGAYEHDIIRGVELALLGPDGSPNTGDEADVINLSLGFSPPPWWLADIRSGRVTHPTVRAFERAASMGKIVVVAAGNAAGHMTINDLCGAQGVICVGSSNQKGTNDRGDDVISWFSSRGPLPWFDVGPTVVAPGENIYSTIPTAIASEWNLHEPALPLSGTSMAAPHVAGAVALLIEHYKRQGRTLTVDMATRLLIHSSTTVKTTWALDNAGAHEAGAGLIEVYNAAFSDLLVEINGSYMLTVLALGDKVNLTLTALNLGTSTLTADMRVWFDDSFRPPREGYEHVVTISPSRITIPPGGRAEATITIDVGKLPPGLYGGYIDLLVGGRSYRAVVSLVVPAKLERREFSARSEVELLIGRHSGLGWTPFEWVMAVFYVDRPLRDMATIRVEITDIYAAPVAVKIFDPRAGYMLSSGPPGYIFGNPGLYVVLVELDILYWFLAFTYRSLWGKVVLEAPLLEDTFLTFQSRLFDLQAEVSMLSARISGLESRMSDIESRLKGIESRLSYVEATLSAIQSKVSDIEFRVNATSQELSAVEAQVGQLVRSLDEVTSRLASLESYAKILASNMSRLELRVNALEVEVANSKIALEGLRKDLEALRSEFTDTTRRLRAEIDSVRGDAASLAGKLDKTALELKSLIEASEARTAGALEEQAKHIESIAGNLKLLAVTLDKLESNLREVNKTANLRLERVGARIAEQEALIKRAEDNLSKLRENLDKTSRELEEARRTLEEMIVKEAGKVQETATRGAILGLAALVIGAVAAATAGYTILKTRSGKHA